jgi:hypothetical protein
VIVRLRGEAPNLDTGDVVSVPLSGVHRPEGVLLKTPGERESRWTVDANAAALTIDSAAQCPNADEILAAAKKK